MFYGSVIGQRGFIKQELEQKFVCKLKIPQHGVSSSYIEISAKCERQILAVADRIECIVSDARRKSRPNYFVCLPCTTPHILKSYAKFKEDVLAKAEADTTDAYFGVDEDLFIKETKLHLTLAVLLLVDQREVALASQLLADFGKQKIVNEKPFKLSIRGLNCMNDEPKSAYVLYATLVEDAEKKRLQTLADSLSDFFIKHGLLHDEYRSEGAPTKLHLTVLNASKRAKRIQHRLQADARNAKGRFPHFKTNPFTGIGVLRDFSEFRFVDEGIFDEMQLCSMGDGHTEEKISTTFYNCIAKWNFSN